MVAYFEDFLKLQRLGGLSVAPMLKMPIDDDTWVEMIGVIALRYEEADRAIEHGRYENTMKGFEALIKKPGL